MSHNHRQSEGQILLRDFLRQNHVRLGGLLLLLITLAALFAGFLSPNSPYEEFRDHFYQPPSSLSDLRFFVRSWEYQFLGVFQTNVHLIGAEAPTRMFLLGTDQLGRGVYSRILHGAQVSLSLALLGVLLTSLLGVTMGGLAGYFGGKADHWIMRCAEIIMCIPALYLILSIRSILPAQLQDLYDKTDQWLAETYQWQQLPETYWPLLCGFVLLISYYIYSKKRIAATVSVSLFLLAFPGKYLSGIVLDGMRGVFPGTLHVSNRMIYALIITTLSFVGWGGMSRVVRGMVLSLKEQEYVAAARALGCSHARILIRHILPGTMSYVLVRASLLVPAFILAESTLSFLGVGIQEPVPSWGNILSAAQDIRVLRDYNWMLSPAAFLFVATMAFNLVGDGLRHSLLRRQ